MLTRFALLLALMGGSLVLSSPDMDKSQPKPRAINGAFGHQSPRPSGCSPRPHCLDGTVFDARTCGCVPFPPMV
jgi:hypothetical protein